MTLALSPASRAVPSGGWDGQQPRRFELVERSDVDAVDEAGEAPPPEPPTHPELVTYDLRSLIDARLYPET